MVSALKELKVCRDNISIQKYLRFNIIDLMMFLKAYENMKRELILPSTLGKGTLHRGTFKLDLKEWVGVYEKEKYGRKRSTEETVYLSHRSLESRTVLSQQLSGLRDSWLGYERSGRRWEEIPVGSNYISLGKSGWHKRYIIRAVTWSVLRFRSVLLEDGLEVAEIESRLL